MGAGCRQSARHASEPPLEDASSAGVLEHFAFYGCASALGPKARSFLICGTSEDDTAIRVAGGLGTAASS